jgi:uncharacterized membrane protein
MNKTFLTVFALIGIFLCGAIAGGVISVRYVRATVQKKAAEQQLNSQQWMRIANRLNPTEEQREKIRAIITAYMKDQQNVRKATQAATDKAHADITAVLTPAQSAEYEKIRGKLRDSDKMWQHWFREQRAKYGDLPLPPSGPQFTPQQPADSPRDNAKRPGGKQGGGKKQFPSTPSTTGTDAP